MSGPTTCGAPGISGASLTTDPYICAELNSARTAPLTGPTITPPTPIADTLMPTNLQQAITGCTGACRLVAYDFDSGVVTKATDSSYVIDTYSTTGENSAVLVTKGNRTSGTISGITADPNTGGSTGTVTYTADDRQVYTFQGRWPSLLTNGTTVTVYFDPVNKSKGALRPEDLGIGPPVLVQPPGYELPDFQASVVTATNSLGTPTVASVEECAKKCDETSTCTGFNFGGLDTSTVCELVKDTTVRDYADNKVGFRKENVSSTQTGDGSSPAGTDLTNEGAYCRDVQACNTDIARIITNNSGSSNPITTLSTNDIESCAYCPIRTYATAGNVTTNELGVSKTNPTPAAAITELQFSNDGTSATHLKVVDGGLYRVKQYIPSIIPYGGVSESDYFVFASLTTNNKWQFYTTGIPWSLSGIDLAYGGPMRVQSGVSVYTNTYFDLVPSDYVTDGFSFINQDGKTYHSLQNEANAPKYSANYNKGIWVFKSITLQEFMNSLQWRGLTSAGYNNEPNPYIYSNSNGDTYKIDINTGLARKFPDRTILDWYIDLNPTWKIWIDRGYDPSISVYNRMIRQDTFWSKVIKGYDTDMPDPYAALGQFRTLDVAPPSTSQSWAYNQRQGCDKNCGNVPNGYAIYKCTASGGGNCDPGKGASVSGPVCSGTYISCRPADDSTDLKNQFSFKFRGLLPVSTKVISGGSNSDHDTSGLSVRTVYSLDTSFSVGTTPNESVQKLYTIFPSFVIDRMLRTEGLQSLIPPAMCAPGLYVKDYGYGIKACDACPGNPTLAPNQVFQPDTANPGNFTCTIVTCPTGEVRDLMTNRCRAPCQPGGYIAPDGTCQPCKITPAGNQYWMPDISAPGNYICTLNTCEGNSYPNASKTGCSDKCYEGTGPDPNNGGKCAACQVSPSRLSVWVSEILGPIGGQVLSYTCALTTCPDGQYPYIIGLSGRPCAPCDQPSGIGTGVTATFGQGCLVTGCSVTDTTRIASSTVVSSTVVPPANCGTTGGCTTVGSCTNVCKPGFTGPSCDPCPQPPGIKATYSSGCIATACSVDTSSPDASKVFGATVVNGNCIATCAPGFWKYLEYGCYTCGTGTGDDPLTTRVYATNSCDPASCTVDASIAAKATAAPATDVGSGRSVCMLTPKPGYYAFWDSSTTVTGNYIQIAGPFDFRTMTFTRSPNRILACPAGDAGTSYTYSSACSLATCTYTNPNDPNEIAASITDTDVQTKCKKVCKSGYKRDASGKCTVACSPMSDPGLTTTFGPWGCKISACTSSSGFPTTITPGSYGPNSTDVCTIACPQGQRQYTNLNVLPNREDCTICTTDLSLHPWIFNSTCGLVAGACASYGAITAFFYYDPYIESSIMDQYVHPVTATAAESGGTCRTTCTTGYVKDSYGICRKCPNETPSSTSAVVNGLCVTTCKPNHSRDPTYDTKYTSPSRTYSNFNTTPTDTDVTGTQDVGQLYNHQVICPKCAPGMVWSVPNQMCVNCSDAETVSSKMKIFNGIWWTSTPLCMKSCKPGYYTDMVTGSCLASPAGYYSQYGDFSKKQCPVGSYCPAGSITATQCSIGYSCPTAGLSSQTVCPLTPAPGSIWANPRIDCTTVQCPAGWYCPDAATKNGCYTGDYCPAGTTSASHQCPAGYYCPNTGTKTQCDIGYSCPVASSVQTSCNNALLTGYIWLNPRVDCTYRACKAGYYCPNSTTETQCTKCAEGMYSSTSCTATADASVCQNCPARAIVNGAVTYYYCTSGSLFTCPLNSSSDTYGNYCYVTVKTSTTKANLTTSGPGPFGGSALLNLPGNPTIYLGTTWSVNSGPYLRVYNSAIIYVFKAQGVQQNTINGQWSFYGDFITSSQTIISPPFSSLSSATIMSTNKVTT